VAKIEAYLKSARSESLKWPMRLPTDKPEKETSADVN
jgi:hypothetical protein